MGNINIVSHFAKLGKKLQTLNLDQKDPVSISNDLRTCYIFVNVNFVAIDTIIDYCS